MNEARFSSIHRGLSSVAQKVYAAVPIADEWAIEAVRRELTRKGHTIDLHTIRGIGDTPRGIRQNETIQPITSKRQ